MKSLDAPRVLTKEKLAQLEADLSFVDLIVEVFGEPKE